jgi:hypothetical protein
MRVAYVMGTAAGGTGEHVAMLARGGQERGLAVTVHGPAQAGRRFFPGIPSAGPHGPAAVTFVPVEIAGRPRPGRDAAAVLRLRRLLAGTQPEVVHAHGLRGLARLRHSRWPGRAGGAITAAHSSSPCTTPRPQRARPVPSTRCSSGSSPAGRTR